MPRSRISIALYLFLVFGSGILVGIVSNRLYSTSTASANATAPGTMSEFRNRYLDGMRTKVGVNEQQLHDRIQQEHIDEVKALLTPQQIAAYDNWRAERERAKLAQQQKKK